MPWNGSGSFNRIYSWVADKVAGLNISSTRMDQDSNDIASNGFGNCLTRDGQGIATANLPMGAFRHTGVANGVARTDYAALGQLQDGTVNWVVAGGTADALTATYSPAVTALVDGQLFFVRATAANLTTTPTFQANATTAHTITKYGGTPVIAGDIIGNLAEIILRYNLANTRFELLNPSTAVLVPGSVTNSILANVAAWTLKGNNTSAPAAPQDIAGGSVATVTPATTDSLLGFNGSTGAIQRSTVTGLQSALSFSAPTIQTFTSGTSLTYTPTAGFKRIKVRMPGGGGGGGASGSGAGTNGNTTSFGTWTAVGGNGGAASGGNGGAGGTGGTNGTGTLVTRIPGGAGQGGLVQTGGNAAGIGGQGGTNPFGGAGNGGGGAAAGGAGATNSGAGGGGGGGSASNSGAGGGAGEYVEFWMTAAQVGASQTYTVGASVAGGSTSGQAGGGGAAGQIIVEEWYI